MLAGSAGRNERRPQEESRIVGAPGNFPQDSGPAPTMILGNLPRAPVDALTSGAFPPSRLPDASLFDDLSLLVWVSQLDQVNSLPARAFIEGSDPTDSPVDTGVIA